MVDESGPAAFGGLNPNGTVECGRCRRVIAYDASRSIWLDETGIPSCAPGPNGEFLEHVPQDSEWMRAALAEPEPDPLERYTRWPKDNPE
jgi:hypothetical protein